ncbi:excalibur calcium-binding domain-containing protein [Streptomyces flavidovirens]|uniref:excalibur calcium-binding domain-containing protein n=1 Tax=Streptomyces flavidovirens TaxID=67298 RepID=UPI00042332DA|nr:excalibur calcium-binding domain-containing protein [Streptomyces flavidovirens]
MRGASAAGVALLAVALVGCGGDASGDTDDGGKVVAASAGASEKATPSEPEPKAELELVDDEESADAAEPVVVKVLDNDTVVPASGGKARAVEAELEAEEFTLAVDVQPAHGSVKVYGTSIVYTSTGGYGGEDEFTYRLDVKGVKGTTPKLSDTAVVRITVTRPAPKVTPKATQTPKPRKATKPKTVAPPPVYYENCDAARAAGAAPVRSGDPGYGRHLDRDGDGVGCEPYNGSSGGGGSTTSGGSGGGSGSGGGGAGAGASYANCDAVRAAGAAPIRVGDPGYGRHLDRDGDGVACE